MYRHLSLIAVACAVLMHEFVPSAGELDVGGAVFQEECYENIIASDADVDGRLDQSEYVLFAQLQGPGIIDDVQLFSELPADYIAVYSQLACLCSQADFGGDPSNPDCCVVDNTIRIPGPPGEGQSDVDLRMLFAICALTDAAANSVLGDREPSASPNFVDTPTLSPATSPTGAPTNVSPTFAPTLMPVEGTRAPVPDPTAFPTRAPIVEPTTPPTSVPTAQPTGAPTSAPTSDPTGTPTITPTTAPTTFTAAPTTLAPTNSPTSSAAPSPSPSKSPTPRPTISPVPTDIPTIAPTRLPTVSPFFLQTYVNYSVAFVDGQNVDDLVGYYAELILGMNTLAENTASTIVWEEGRRRRLQQSYSVAALRPTRIVEDVTVDCNPAVTTEDDQCHDIRSEVTLEVSDHAGANVDIVEMVSTYQTTLFNAIFDGKLQDELDENLILVTTGLDDGSRVVDPPEIEDDGDTLSSGAIGAIVGASLFGVALPLCIFMYTRSRARYEAEIKRDARYQSQQVGEVEERPGSELEPASVDTSLYTDAAVQSTTYNAAREVGAMGGGSAVYRGEDVTLGATQPDYGRASKRAVAAMEAGDDIVAEPEMDVQADSSSNAGSSGWSSSEGFSSYNTGSMDDSTDAAAAAGATLAAIGVSSNLSRKLEAERKKGGGVVAGAGGDGQVSRDQLDQLIEAGDWAAVGATAALLAAASDSQSQTSRSGAGSRQGSSAAGSLDAARAAELDHLVEAGDWEGVVLAAARFEATDAAGSRGSRSGQSIDSASATDSATGGGGTASSPSVQSESLTASDDPSKVKKRAEIREEVEALVRRVVPEEIDNVDEMMNQFKGREEELVETLRTMQERAVAQKARAAGQRAAKAEARRSVQRGIVPGAGAVKASPGGEASQEGEAGTPTSQAASSSASSASGSHGEARTALEEAIDAGDWEAVGRAAAMMSDASTPSSGDAERFASGMSLSSGGTGSRSSLGGINAARAAELDAMIDRGDWSGVVAAANRFSESDKKPAAKSGRTKEEEEALAEAEKWAKIAQQKKPVATDAAASEATEWAIQRSLSQMKQAEKDEATAPSNDEEDEV